MSSSCSTAYPYVRVAVLLTFSPMVAGLLVALLFIARDLSRFDYWSMILEVASDQLHVIVFIEIVAVLMNIVPAAIVGIVCALCKVRKTRLGVLWLSVLGGVLAALWWAYLFADISSFKQSARRSLEILQAPLWFFFICGFISVAVMAWCVLPRPNKGLSSSQPTVF